VREAVRIPVWMSSLVQLPVIAAGLAPSRPIAIITANSENLTPEFMTRAGVAVRNPVVICGMQRMPEFRSSVLEEKGSIDAALIEEEIVGLARQVKEKRPDLGAVLLECSMLPPYAKAVQDAVGVPVFDFITMIDFLYAATHQRRYEGYY